ncbi:MAG: hypothetical protein QW231_04345, partial [Candidatus Bathyarchaeia archaeon]
IAELLPNAGRLWTVAEKVEYCMGLCDSALIIATPDEIQNGRSVPRIDVTYELGRLKGKKVIVLKEEKTQLPKSLEPVYVAFALDNPQACLNKLDEELESIYGKDIIKLPFLLEPPKYRSGPVYTIEGRGLVPERSDLIQKEVRNIFTKSKEEQIHVVKQIIRLLDDENEDKRWIAGLMLEEILQYDSKLVPRDAILKMSRDKSFSVRSSAAVCLFTLANFAPGEVPLDVVRRLASKDEDWYVYMPALATLKVLAHKISKAVEILVEIASSDNPSEAEYGVSALLHVVKNDAEILHEDMILHLRKHKSKFVRESAEEILQIIKRKPSMPKVIRYSPF